MTPAKPLVWRDREVGRYVDLGEGGIWFEPDAEAFHALEGMAGRYFNLQMLHAKVQDSITRKQSDQRDGTFYRKGEAVGVFDRDVHGFHFMPSPDFPELADVAGTYGSLREIHKAVGVCLEGER